jgi:hypothetical protein
LWFFDAELIRSFLSNLCPFVVSDWRVRRRAIIWRGDRLRLVEVILWFIGIWELGVKGGLGGGRGVLVRPENEGLRGVGGGFWWGGSLEVVLWGSVGRFGSLRKEKKLVDFGMSFFNGLNRVFDFRDGGF